MKIIKENWSSILTVLFLIVVGVLLLVNPATFGMVIIKVAGGLLAALGVYDLLRYFRAKPEEAAKGSSFYSGAILITMGLFCFFGQEWFKNAFPVPAVLYGLFQILIGFRKLQQTVDTLRLKQPVWYMKAFSAGISLLFGFLIAFNLDMNFMSIWMFTGVTLVIEGVFDAVALGMQIKKTKKAE